MTQQQTYDGPTEIVQTTNLGTPTAFCSVRHSCVLRRILHRSGCEL